MEKSRQELFELVWSMPMTKLSKQFELSDVGLRKICIKHQIPLPLQGHWTRKQFGKEAPRPELPDKDFNPIIEINDDYKIKLNKELLLLGVISINSSKAIDIKYRDLSFKEESIEIDFNRKCIECAELVGPKRLKKNPNFYRCESCQLIFEANRKNI